MRIKVHNYHLVTNSPWPIFVSLYILYSILGVILSIYNSIGSEYLLTLGTLGISICIYFWFKDILIESTYKGEHTIKVQKGIQIGLILFIISEVCLFATLFFSYFYNSLIPSIELASYLPPIGIYSINPKALPLLNTFILFISGLTSTISLNLFISNSNYINNSKYYTIFFLLITIFLGIIFSYFQYLEYYTSSFTITDSIYGSNLYLLTGFHGVHVIVGIILLISATIRIILNHLTKEHYLLLSFANLYWHFVDYVWIVLYIFLYCWNS